MKTLLLFMLIVVAFSAKLPSTFRTCKRKSNDFNRCLNEAIENALHQTVQSFPAIGIPSFDPFEIPSMVIGKGKGPVNVVQNYKNVQLYGIPTVKLGTTNMDFDEKLLSVNASISEFKLIGDFDVNGYVLSVPIVGKGRALLKLSNVQLYNELQFDEFNKHNKTYYKPIKAKALLYPEHAYVNVFNGNQQLTDNINRLLNENWKEVFNDVKSGYEQVYADIMLQLSTNVFTRVPIDDIFPN